ncbi:putative bifunctional diguanylate cyclase/phosphodiesterase [Erythrobacter sp.]|jgi:diguanylate cyclase (GGDEF)-like protein|uniref:putative bifunctional diguanylate cyclase/phosphodiesterase n=1 Tax=Erythrobacter sp. TaxID=1042 RepID=UPI002ECCED6A|nr:EAL domain-containing protein [Erythrobacter sp.]
MLRLMGFLLPTSSPWELREQVVENFKNLCKQIPLLYAAALVNLIGLHIATDGQDLTPFSAVNFLTALLAWRMTVWIFFQRDSDDFDEIAPKLITTVVLTVVQCIGFSIWALSLIDGHPDKAISIVLFSILAALGAAYGLSSFPRAAMVPLTILGLPMAIRLLFIKDAETTGMGISLLLVILLLMRLLQTHSGVMAELVTSRLAVAKERNRAISAEVAAIKRADEDSLTRLANRSRMFREIERTMVQGPPEGGGSLVAISDLDGFKAANDVFGHAAGDAILKTYASRLREAFGDRALVARTGGDEFVLFWRDGLTRTEIEAIGHEICRLASVPIDWKGKHLHVGASCGLTEAGPLSETVSEFLRQADSALYRAKARGRGVWQIYDHGLLELDQRRAGLERILLNRENYGEMTVEFQPIVCLDTNSTVYAEALARWNSPGFGFIPPDEFIPVAEQLGAITELNGVLLREAANLASSWPVDLGVSFNLSALEISERGSSIRLLGLIESAGISPGRIQFEVTETAFLADLSTAKQELERLREAGCMIALDDFGSGHASVSYLRDLVFDVVKLDGSLTAEIEYSDRSRQILLGLIDLCHATGAKCVAEHVETLEQLMLIKAMGCDFAQGYYLGRPALGMPDLGGQRMSSPRTSTVPATQIGGSNNLLR